MNPDEPLLIRPKLIESDRFSLLEECLGSGYNGAVFAGHDNLKDEEVAIKINSPNEVAKEQRERRKIDEVIAARKESTKMDGHENLLRVDPHIDAKGNIFYVMPRMAMDLNELVDAAQPTKRTFQSGLTKKKTFQYIDDIIDAAAFAHSKWGLAHGDISLKNTLLGFDGIAKLGDFGTSTADAIAKRSDDPRDNIGNIAIRAYELEQDGSHPDFRSDVFSLGVCAFKLIAGNYPVENFEGDYASVGPNEKEQIIHDSISRDVPWYLKSVLKKATALNPSERFQNAGEFLDAYRGAVKLGKRTSGKALATYAALGLVGLGLGVAGNNVIEGKNQEILNQMELTGEMRNKAGFYQDMVAMQKVLNDYGSQTNKVDIRGEFEANRDIYSGEKVTELALATWVARNASNTNFTRSLMEPYLNDPTLVAKEE